MADNVWIEGSDVEWATEKTQMQLLSAMTEAFKLNKTDSQKLNKALGDAAKQGGFIGKEGKTAFKEFTSGLKEAGDEALDSAAGFSKLKGPMKGFGEQLKESSKKFKLLAAGVFGLGAILGKIYGRYIASVDVLRDMADAGVMYQETHMDISRILAETGMNMADFSEFTQKYTRIIAQNGLRSITNLVDKTDELVGGFAQYGLTTAEATEYVADYMDRQRMLGVYSTATQQGMNEAVQRNIERLTQYSKILNVSRKELIEQSKEAMTREDVRRRFFAMDVQQRKKAQDAFDASIQVFGAFGEEGAKLGQNFTDLMARLNPQTAELLKGLRAAGGADIANALIGWKQQVEAGIPVTEKQVKTLGDMLEANKGIFNQLGQSESQYASVADFLGSLGLRLQEAEQAVDKSKKTSQDGVAAAASLADGLNKTRESALHLATDTLDELVKMIGKKGAEGTVTDTLYDLGRGLSNFADSLVKMADRPIGEVIGEMAGGVWEGAKNVFDQGFANVTNAITVGFANVTRSISSLLPWADEGPRPMAATPVGQSYLDLGTAQSELDVAKAEYSAFQNRQTQTGNLDEKLYGGRQASEYQALIKKLEDQVAINLKIYRELKKQTDAIDNQS